MTSYSDFIHRKSQIGGVGGFEPTWLPDWLKPFQAFATAWSIRTGRAAQFFDCGLGKTPISAKAEVAEVKIEPVQAGLFDLEVEA